MLTARSSNCSISAKFLPMLVETPYFGGVINTKTYLNHELGSNFFFLSDLEYKLVNLLVFEKCSCKMSKSWIFQKNIDLGLNFTYEFEVCYTVSPSSWPPPSPVLRGSPPQWFFHWTGQDKSCQCLWCCFSPCFAGHALCLQWCRYSTDQLCNRIKWTLWERQVWDQLTIRVSKMCGRATAQIFSDFAQNLEICMLN